MIMIIITVTMYTIAHCADSKLEEFDSNFTTDTAQHQERHSLSNEDNGNITQR